MTCYYLEREECTCNWRVKRGRDAARYTASEGRVRVMERLSVNLLESQLAIVAARWTAGPSRPTDALTPIEAALTVAAPKPSRRRIFPWRSALA